MPDLPKDQDEWERSFEKLLDQALPPSEEASLPTHLMHLVKQFVKEGFTDAQALYLVMAVITQNPGPAPPR